MGELTKDKQVIKHNEILIKELSAINSSSDKFDARIIEVRLINLLNEIA